MNINFRAVPSLIWQRIRPWWGRSPVRLIISAAISFILIGIIIYYLLQYRADRAGSGDSFLDAAFELGSFEVGVMSLIFALLALWAAIGTIQVAVAVFDLMFTTTVEGLVVSVRRHQVSDVLPPILRNGFYIFRNFRNRRNYQYRQTERGRLLVTLHTDSKGPRNWPMHYKVRSRLPRGGRVRIRVTPLTGYIRSVEVLSTAE